MLPVGGLDGAEKTSGMEGEPTDTNQRDSPLRKNGYRRLACKQVCGAVFLVNDGCGKARPTVGGMAPGCTGKQTTRSRSGSCTPPWPLPQLQTRGLALTSFDNHCGVEMSTKQPPPQLVKVFHHSWPQRTGHKIQQCNNTWGEK